MSSARRIVPILAISAILLTPLAGCADRDDEARLPEVGGEQAERGRTLVRTAGCTSCHSGDGGGSVGPTWKGLAGSEVELEDGSTVIADAAYLRESITDPNAKVVKGYAPVMPTTRFEPDDLEAVVAYLMELGDS